jgi:hypothetical protein
VYADTLIAAGPIQPGIGTASVTRATSAVVLVPCTQGRATIDLRTAGSLKVNDNIVCPPGSIIDQVTAVLKINDINNQSSVIGGSTKTAKCGGSSCNASITFGSRSTGLYDISVSYTAHFPQESPKQSVSVGFVVPYNKSGVAYPQHADTRMAAYTIVPFPAPPPAIQGCPQNGSTQPTGCSNRSSAPDGTSFAANLKALYVSQGWPQAVFSSVSPEAHHIQPLCWGGANDSAKNGVYLAHADHLDYTTWWTGVSVSGVSETCSSTE